MKSARATAVPAFLLLSLLFAVTAASATRGLDLTFGSGGVVMDHSMDGASDLAIDGDGKIVAAGRRKGDLIVARYLTDGSPDATFGVDGVARIDVGGRWRWWTGVALDGAGNVIAGGTATIDGAARATVVRLDGAGALDPSFGQGGVATRAPKGWYEGACLAVSDPGDVWLAGAGRVDGIDHVMVASFMSSGAPNAGYGRNGVATVGQQRRPIYPHGCVRQDDDRLVLTGAAESPDGRDVGVVTRMDADGTVDRSFGTQGWSEVDLPGRVFPQSIALQEDGRVVVGGWTSGMFLARFLPGGRPDAGFGDGGARVYRVRLGAVGDLVIGADGTVVAPGTSREGFTVLAAKPDGRPLRRFGDGGVLVSPIGNDSAAVAAVLQADGEVVAAGWTYAGGHSNDAFLARVSTHA